MAPESVGPAGASPVTDSAATYALAQIIADAVTGAESAEANGPEVGLFVLDGLDMAGYKVVAKDAD